MLLALTLSTLAHAATWTAEDLVTAHARGLPADTTARLAESVGTDAATAVYLLRRGLSGETLTTWGYVVGEAERAEAQRLGALTAAPPVVDHRPRADAAALTVVVYDDLQEDVLPSPTPRRGHLRRGRTGIIAGTLLAVAGGITFAGAARGTADACASCRVGPYDLMGVGAIGLLAAGISFHFGAEDLRLAGAYPRGWEPRRAE